MPRRKAATTTIDDRRFKRLYPAVLQLTAAQREGHERRAQALLEALLDEGWALVDVAAACERLNG